MMNNLRKFFKRFSKKEAVLEKEIVEQVKAEEKKAEKFFKKNGKKIGIFAGIIFFLCVAMAGASYLYWNNVVLKAGANLKFGFIGDFEYGYKEKIGNKPTKKAPEALEKAVEFFNNEFHPEILISAGDMVESSLSKKNTTIKQFGEINEIFLKIQAARRGYVFGNHDLRDLTKEELRGILGMEENHSYFDHGDWRFVLMDTNFKKDGSDLGPNFYVEGLVSEAEFEWLKVALDTDRPTILFAHHSSMPDEVDGKLVSNPKNMANGLELHNFLKQYDNLVLFAAGHEPGYVFETVDGINYLIPGNIATFKYIGNFTSLEAKYNKYTKEAKIIVEKHGEHAGKFEIEKEVGLSEPWVEWLEKIWEK